MLTFSPDAILERNYDDVSQAKPMKSPESESIYFQNITTESAFIPQNPQTHMEINRAGIWLAGIILLGTISIIQTWCIYRRVKHSEKLHDNIYLSNRINTPFVLGLLTPHIYIPSNIKERSYIIAHEKIHIKRKNYGIKVLFWIAVILHWYNPIVWIAFREMENDMEMSCDEKVIKTFSDDIRVQYSTQLLEMTSGRSSAILTVQFIRGGMMRRFKNIFQNKKDPKGFETIAVLILALSLTTGCMVSGKTEDSVAVTTDDVAVSTAAEAVTAEAASKTYAAALPADWVMNTMLDTEIPDLDYASENMVIFHGYFGLFVYDLQAKQMISSLSLKDLGCQKVQTGGTLRILVSEDGEVVYLYPYEKDYMYLFNIRENNIEKTALVERRPISVN